MWLREARWTWISNKTEETANENHNSFKVAGKKKVVIKDEETQQYLIVKDFTKYDIDIRYLD